MNDRETTHPLAPPHPDRVRMPLMRINWYFKPVSKGKRTLLELTCALTRAVLCPIR